MLLLLKRLKEIMEEEIKNTAPEINFNTDSSL